METLARQPDIVAEKVTARYAEIAVDSDGLAESLTYGVPPELQQMVRPGQLVWVPLRNEQAQGVVLSVSPDPPQGGFKVRTLTDIADPTPVLWEYQVELLRWIASYYYCGLYEAATLMLPPGISRSARPTLALTEAGNSFFQPPGLSSNELGLLDILRDLSPKFKNKDDDSDEPPGVPVPDLKKKYLEKHGKTTFEKTARLLVEKDLVARGFLLPRPGVKPKIKPFVRLAPYLLDLPPDDPEVQKRLGSAAKQRRIFEILQQAVEPGYLMPADELLLGADSDMPTLKKLAAKGLVEIEEREVRRDPLANRPMRLQAEEPPLLTFRQSAVWRTLLDSFHNPEPHTYLMHGVTGSGKTELYLRAIARTLREGKGAIVLVPEIALTAQMVDRFVARFPGQVAVRHSKLSAGEAYDEWRRLRDGKARIVIGARSALFSPLPNPGLIIIDEEHEWSYKQDESFVGPLYHAREAALKLSALTGAKLILGSATPSVESYFRAEQGEHTLLQLPERVMPGGADGSVSPLPLPSVQIVDLKQELKAGNSSIFSRDLQQNLGKTLHNERQAILFLNRRGTATIVMCRDCGSIVVCDQCDSPLVYHADLDKLICHRCGVRRTPPKNCPNPACGSPRIRHMGAGTKRVEDELQRMFPGTRILRWDQDTIAEGGRDAYQILFDKMANHEADLLVGTQMIAKGLDLPLVALVGIVTADTGLYLPDFRSTERTFQLLTQVAGRAGRSTLAGEGRVVMQSYTPDHYVIETAAKHDFGEFYGREIQFRLDYGYPPFARLIKFVYSHKDEAQAQAEVSRLAREIELQLEENGIAADAGIYDFIGPAPAFQRKLRNQYRYQFILRLYGTGLAIAEDTDFEAQATIRNIIGRMRPHLYGWTVDVDPQSLL
jgi:primosomal protein N' (replication factor Y) (superfamily II helicase)